MPRNVRPSFYRVVVTNQTSAVVVGRRLGETRGVLRKVLPLYAHFVANDMEVLSRRLPILDRLASRSQGRDVHRQFKELGVAAW